MLQLVSDNTARFEARDSRRLTGIAAARKFLRVGNGPAYARTLSEIRAAATPAMARMIDSAITADRAEHLFAHVGGQIVARKAA